MKNVNNQQPANLYIDPVYQKLAVHLFLTIMRHWDMCDTDAMFLAGLDDWETYLNWKQKMVSPLDEETYMRLSTVIEVNKQARYLYTNKDEAMEWLRTKHPEFDCHSPIDYILMRDIKGMHNVNRYLYFKAHIEPEMKIIN